MSAYYNEIDPFAAAWLRELIKQGDVAPGDVDERSIEDVKPDDLKPYKQCHFFAGVGAWSYALRLAGWPDDKPVWTGSCPCQPFSEAGEGNGFADERHLWPAWHWLIRECAPSSLFGEQVASSLAKQWIDLVQADLEALGYAFGGGAFPAAGIGFPQIRLRTYWMAYAGSQGRQGYSEPFHLHDSAVREEAGRHAAQGGMAAPFWRGSFQPERGADGRLRFMPGESISLPDGAPSVLGQVRGYGNAINAEQAAAFVQAAIEAVNQLARAA